MQALLFPLLLGTVYNLSRNSYLSVLPLYFQDAGLGDAQISFIFTAFPLMVVLSSGVLGRLSDQIGRVVIIRMGVLLEIVALALYLLVPGFWTFLIARMLNSVAFVALGIVGFSQSEDSIKKEDRYRMTGYVLSIQSAAMAVGPVIAGVLGSVMFFFPLYFSLTLTTLLYVFVAFYMKRHHIPKNKIRVSRKDISLIAEIKEFLAHPQLRALSIPAVGAYVAAPLVFIYMPLYMMNDLGGGIMEMALMQLALWSCHFLQYAFGRKIQENNSAPKIILYVPLAFMLLYFAVPFTHSVMMLIALCFWFSLFDAFWLLAMMGILSDIGEESHMEGKVMGTYFTIIKLAQFFASLIASIMVLFVDISLIFFVLSGTTVYFTLKGRKAFKEAKLI